MKTIPAIAGNDEHAAEVARQTQEDDAASVTLVTNSDQHGIPDEIIDELAAGGIRVNVDRIVGAHAREKGVFAMLRLGGGEELELDHLFSVQGADPNAALAHALGVETASNGYIQTDTEQRTNVPGVYAAGDVTRLFSHLVLTAAHEGATAATALSYDLYQRERETYADQSAGTR